MVLAGWKNHKETLELISNARALINTSYYEGFPNIFLEAWGTGVPVISLTVNPGDIFNKFNLGICCDGDINKMKLCIEKNKTGQLNRQDLREYVERFHDFKSAADRFINAITPRALKCWLMLMSMKKMVLLEEVKHYFV